MLNLQLLETRVGLGWSSNEPHFIGESRVKAAGQTTEESKI